MRMSFTAGTLLGGLQATVPQDTRQHQPDPKPDRDDEA